MSVMASPRDEIAFLEGWLSERALSALLGMRARRVPELTHDRQEIVKRLREARLPTAKPILELEETIGGLELRVDAGRSKKAARLSIFEALSQEEAFCRERGGARLVPLCLGRSELPFYDLYVDEAGHIHEIDEIAGGGPIAESWIVLLERLALGTVRVVPPPGVPRAYTPVLAAEDIAPAVGAEAVHEVSDGYQRLYTGPDIHLSEQAALDDAPAGTTIATSNRGLLARALQALHTAHPEASVRLTRELLSAPGDFAGQTPWLRTPWSPGSRSDLARELLVLGPPTHPVFVAR